MDVAKTPTGPSGLPASDKRDQSYHLESAHYRNNDSVSLDVLTLVEQQHITTVSHVGFSDALIAQKPSPWTKTMFKLYFFLFIAFLNSCINGYDGSLMGGINAMQYYQRLVYFFFFLIWSFPHLFFIPSPHFMRLTCGNCNTGTST